MNNSKLTIRCEEDCEMDFKLLCLKEKKHYGEFLKKLVDFYKQYNTQNESPTLQSKEE